MKPLKIWAFLDNFFFHGFQWGTKGKMLKKTMYSFGNFSAFFLWSPLGNYEKKSCLNKLKFWEASQNQKRSICWKFQLSISLGRQKSPSTIQAGAKLNKPFCLFSRKLPFLSWKINTNIECSSRKDFNTLRCGQNVILPYNPTKYVMGVSEY